MWLLEKTFCHGFQNCLRSVQRIVSKKQICLVTVMIVQLIFIFDFLDFGQKFTARLSNCIFSRGIFWAITRPENFTSPPIFFDFEWKPLELQWKISVGVLKTACQLSWDVLKKQIGFEKSIFCNCFVFLGINYLGSRPKTFRTFSTLFSTSA